MSTSENYTIDLSPLGTNSDGSMIPTDVHVFINVHDRLESLVQLTNWLKRAGHENITLIDNASTYPPLLRFLKSCPYKIIRLKRNLGQNALWKIPAVRKIISEEWFVYTDPDVVPTETCPLDAVVHLYDLLKQFPGYLKAGLGLRLDDIPDQYHLKQRVIEHEASLYGREIAPSTFQADVDTTFALYRPRTPPILGPAMRTRGIYEARHLPWYTNSASPGEEECYYRAHCLPGITTWSIGHDYSRGMQNTNIPGGVAAQIENDPQAFLAYILNSKPGKIISAYRKVSCLISKRRKAWRLCSDTAATQAEFAILEILTSETWRILWSVMEPWRSLRLRLSQRS